MNLLPYPEYKDSGIEWLGGVQIPSSWTVRKLGHVVQMKSGEAITAEFIQAAGMHPVFGGGGFRGYTPSFTNDGSHVLIGRQGALCGNIKRANNKFFATEHAIVTYPVTDLFLTWLAGVLEVMDLGQYSQSAAQPGISVDVIAKKKLPVPPYEEQQAIAEYLDHETAEIDAFIADQNELIGLLNERRAATITQAVTKGLDPNAPMKDSGVEWLGEVPQNWQVLSGRRLFTQRKESAKSDDTQLAASQEYGVIDQARYTELTGFRVTQVLKGLEILKHVEPQDFVISMRSFQGGLEYSAVRGKISSAYVMLRASDTVNFDYFRYLFKSRGYIAALQATSNLVRDGQAMRYSNFCQVLIPRPNLEEQQGIADYLDHETAEIDAAIADAKEAIKLSKERRVALISAAVTGKIDVRDHQRANGTA